MRLRIAKKSGRAFPPPFNNSGFTAIATGITTNMYDPNKCDAYILENGKIVNCNKCVIVENLE